MASKKRNPSPKNKYMEEMSVKKRCVEPKRFFWTKIPPMFRQMTPYNIKEQKLQLAIMIPLVEPLSSPISPSVVSPTCSAKDDSQHSKHSQHLHSAQPKKHCEKYFKWSKKHIEASRNGILQNYDLQTF